MNDRGRTAVPSSQFPVPSGRRGRAARSRKGPNQKEGVLFGKNAVSGLYPLEPQELTFAIFFFCRTSRFNTEGEGRAGRQFPVPGSRFPVNDGAGRLGSEGAKSK